MAPAFVKYIRNDDTASPSEASNMPIQPIDTIGEQKTVLDSEEGISPRRNSMQMNGAKKGGRNESWSSQRSGLPSRAKEANPDTRNFKSMEFTRKQKQDATLRYSQATTGTANRKREDVNAKRVIIKGSQSAKNEMMQLLREGKKCLTVHELNDILASLTRQKRYTEAISIVELTERKPLSDLLTVSKSVKAYTIMIDLYGRAQQLDRAFSVFRSMCRKGVQPNVVTYNAMIAACSRSQEPSLANEVYEEMKENGLQPDKFTFGTLIDLSAKCGNAKLAFDLSNQMSENGVLKDQTIYSALMEACGRAGQPDRAFRVYESMKKKGVWPNMVVFSVLIDICSTTRDPERAFHIFAEARHWGFRKLNVIVYTALIDACAKGGWPEKAELVFRNMVQEGVKPNHITFGTLIDGWARKGEFDKAFGVLRRMEVEHRVKPTAILVGGLIDACRRYRQCSRVKKLWDVIVRYNIKPSRLYYPGLIGMAVSAGELQIACAIVLHAYARGNLRRVSLNSEAPGLRAMASALIYLRHELDKDAASPENLLIVERLHVVFGSVPMTNEQMDAVPASEARDLCISWGDPKGGNDRHLSNRLRPSNRGRTAVSRGERQGFDTVTDDR
ncbi:hypothetical protein FGB62_40g160 [Gracilaria domingensis]|nr:hypothetical protein FGB62_40g160 [Gracilaria domingensis]